MLLVERCERCPSLAGVLCGHQRLELIRAIGFALEGIDQRGQATVHVGRAHEIEPFDPAAERLDLGEARPAARNSLLHQHQQMPGNGAPWRSDNGILLRIERSDRGVDLDHEQLAYIFEISEAEGFGGGIGADHPHPQEPLAHDRARSRNEGIRARTVVSAPAIGEHVGVEEVDGTHAGAVVEGGAENAIGQLLPGGLAGADGLQHAASGLRDDRITRHADLVYQFERLCRCAALRNRLGENAQAHEGIDHHQRSKRHLRAQRSRARVQHRHRLDMGQIDRRHMAQEDGRHGRVPGKARIHDRDIDTVRCGAEQVPTKSERVGRERNDVLALDQQKREIVREVIADRDGNEGEGEIAREHERT